MQHVIYCFGQLDGLVSTAIVARAMRLRGISCKVGGLLSYTTIEENFKELAALKNCLIFILDFSPEQIKELEEKLGRITQQNKIAYWSSHHPYTLEELQMLKKHVNVVDFSGKLKGDREQEKKLCAAELACRKLLPKDRVALELGSIAHDIEFWVRADERATKLADLIASGFDCKALVDILAKGVFWSEQFEQLRNSYLKKKENALASLMKRLIVKSYLDRRFGFTVASPVLNSADAGQKVLDTHSGVDVAVILFRNGRISFRRRDSCDIDLGRIARLFNGGGHVYASGGNISDRFKTVSLENFDDVLFYLDQKLKGWFFR